MFNGIWKKPTSDDTWKNPTHVQRKKQMRLDNARLDQDEANERRDAYGSKGRVETGYGNGKRNINEAIAREDVVFREHVDGKRRDKDVEIGWAVGKGNAASFLERGTHNHKDNTRFKSSTEEKGDAKCHEDAVAKTHFPEFDLENISDDELKDVGTITEREEKFQCKEDEDVALFLSLASRMSIDSLVFIMQGQARALNLPKEHMYQYARVVKFGKSTYATNQSLLNLRKKVRFAEGTDGNVHTVTNMVRSWKDQKELWYKPEELASTRLEFVKTISFIRKHRPNYVKSVELIAKAATVNTTVEEHMKHLTNYSYCRGMESQLIQLLHCHRQLTVGAVLEEQQNCMHRAYDIETTSCLLRRKSLSFSQISTNFAERMGQVDQIDALKASMSPWRPTPPFSTMAIGTHFSVQSVISQRPSNCTGRKYSRAFQ